MQEANGKDNSSSDGDNQCMVVFTLRLAKQLLHHRLPTGYIGARRIRPSTVAVAKHAAGKNTIVQRSNIVYRIVDPETGVERRMTSQEKKLHKQKQKEEAKKRKLEALEVAAASDSAVKSTTNDTVSNREVDEENSSSESETGGRYQLKIDPGRLEEELADLRGEREGVPPMLLPPPIARLAMQQIMKRPSGLSVFLDDDLARNWATELKDSFLHAETMRKAETSVRPMPYHLVPEVWSRMRPTKLGGKLDETPSTTDTIKAGPSEWKSVSLRRATPHDRNVAAVLQLLYTNTNLHIACGAKFGCEYLVYDGPRKERHAFAGLRILPHEKRIPSPYSMSAYVRCLNTAGKLALLATVRPDATAGTLHVAIIDLTLVKIVETTFKKPIKTMEQRLKNLDKTKQGS